MPKAKYSPCIKVCTYDEHGYCLGCQRTDEEVSSWPYLIIHNLYQTKNILDKAREAILLGSFKNYKESLQDI